MNPETGPLWIIYWFRFESVVAGGGKAETPTRGNELPHRWHRINRMFASLPPNKVVFVVIVSCQQIGTVVILNVA